MGIAIILGVVLGILVLVAVIAAIALFVWNYDDSHAGKLTGAIFTALAGVGLIIAFIFVPFGYYQVDAGEVAVLRNKGQIVGVQTAGLHHRNILTENIAVYDIKTQQLDITTEVYTRDAQPMTAQLTMQFTLNVADVEKIAREYGTQAVLKTRIEMIAIERAKVVLANDTAMGLIENRATLSSDIFTAVAAMESAYYVKFLNVVLTDMAFSAAFEDAVEAKMVEQQKVEQEKAKAERMLIEAEARLKAAEFEKQIAVVQATADAEAMFTIMQLWNGKIWNSVTEEWESVTTSGEELEVIRELMLRQLAIEKWNGELPQTVVGSEFLEWLFGTLGGN